MRILDPRFENTFEKAFPSPNLQTDDFFRVVAGNHDHYGNVTAQLAYADISSRWRFDSLYYSFTETIPASSAGDVDTTLEVVMIDTVVLSGNSDVVNEDGCVGIVQLFWFLCAPPLCDMARLAVNSVALKIFTQAPFSFSLSSFPPLISYQRDHPLFKGL